MSSNYTINKDTKLSQNNFLLLCPVCKLIPKILINELTNEITYICQSSQPKKCKKRNYPLNYFNSSENSNIKNDININTKCNTHNKKYTNYCFSCEKNLCTDCINNNNIKQNNSINNHFKHDFIDLKMICPTGSSINKKK